MSSFHVDARINVKMEVELALRLGEMILASGTEDKQIRALGHMLCNIDKDDEQPVAGKWVPPAERQESSIVSDWQEDSRPAEAPKYSSMRDKVQGRKFMTEANRKYEKWGVE